MVSRFSDTLSKISPEQTVLIAGPTASGKSALALEIAAAQGGVIVNADASQVYSCWRILTARPSAEEENHAPHMLYGHVDARQAYSTGHWLREVTVALKGTDRLIITGGTGLYFNALLNGLAEVPATPIDVRQAGDAMQLEDMINALDAETRDKLDLQNRARVQRAWEVLTHTGTGLSTWQSRTGPPALPRERCFPIVFDAQKEWLNRRIAKRFDLMIDQGVLDETAAVLPHYDPTLPAHRAIGAPELIQHLKGLLSLDAARERSVIATRQYAKRQRTWMRRRMADWTHVTPT